MPTIRTLAASIRSREKFEVTTSVACFRDGNNDVPFFMVHGQNGSVAFLNNILRELQCASTIHTIQARADYGEAASMELLAERYAEEILSSGIRSCILCGFSFGGILSLEIARVLKNAGVHVGLIMLDSKPNRMLRKKRPVLYRVLYGVKVAIWLLDGLRNIFPLIRGKRDAGTFGKRVMKLAARLKRGGNEFTVSDPEASANLYKRYGQHSKKLIRSYQPDPYPGNLLLVKAMKPHTEYIGADFPRNLWTFYVKGRIEVVQLNMHHFDFGSANHAKEVADTIDVFCDRFLLT